MIDWPKSYTSWIERDVLYVSIPFTWCLPEVKDLLLQGDFFWTHAILGGPATKLIPTFFDGIANVTVEDEHPNVLQRINPMATKTSVGCVRKCGFCAVPIVEGKFRELDDWPDLPIICDNNLLACSQPHFDKVMDRLEKWDWCDFNQGLDARLLTEYHAERLARLKGAIVRLALDDTRTKPAWMGSYDTLRAAGFPKSRIRSYILCGFNDDPKDAWWRCEYVQAFGVLALPQWFHGLKQLEKNIVTDNQKALGWTEEDRKRIMGYYYKHRGTVPSYE